LETQGNNKKWGAHDVGEEKQVDNDQGFIEKEGLITAVV
jgi:hypothetical protein